MKKAYNKKKYYRKTKKYMKRTAKGTKAIVKAINTGNGITYINRNTGVHRFVRSDIQFAYLNPVNGVNSSGGIWYFKLGSVPGYTEFTSLFQKYRIEKIKLIFNLVETTSNSSIQPTLYIAKNLEPTNTTIPTQAIMEQQSGCTIMQFSNEHRTFTKSFYPYIATRTLTSSSAASDVIEFTDRRRSFWIDCNDTATGVGSGVVHHGIKWWLDFHTNVLDPTDFQIEVNAEYHLAFKGID